MGKTFEEITSELADWIARQRLFFVATAPMAETGLLNCSPKGMDSFRVLGPRTVGYLDLPGSGIETVAHLQENGRIAFMFCAFEGPPKIVRLQGVGNVITPESAEFDDLKSKFPNHAGARAIIRAELTRISDSCGYGVPKFTYVEERDALTQSIQKKGTDGLIRYRQEKNAHSLDGLPGL